MLHWVADNWKEPDQSIWEVRGGRQHFTYSKLQCWVALDRGLRLADKRSLPLTAGGLRDQRDEIYRAIMRESWNHGLAAFAQFFGSDKVDASALMRP
jgi:GH15 family glucan-1,4-alpha-glucosidase